jgi:ubiquinone/menaquinone biosynthesis C-methylase UbiE
MKRTPEPEVMDGEEEVRAYRQGDFRRVNRLCARRALRAAGKSRGRAIDLGTGPAEIPIHLCEMAPGWSVTAVDASPEMLRAARENVRRSGLSRRIRLLRGDAKRVKEIRTGFDLVLSNSLLHHLEDPLPFWREVARLAAGGAVCIQDLFRPASRAEALRLVKRHTVGASPLLRELFHRSLLAAFTPEEVRGQLAEAGIGGLSVRKVSDRHMTVSGKPRPARAAGRDGRRR